MAPIGDYAIPTQVAIALCAAFRAENRPFWFTPTGLMCYGCRLRSRRHPDRRYFASRQGNRGCYQINARYDGEVRAQDQRPEREGEVATRAGSWK